MCYTHLCKRLQQLAWNEGVLKMNILGICSIGLDTISSVDHLPIADSFCTVLSTQKMQGGSGTNVMVQSQRVGGETAIITKIANDAVSKQILENLAKSHVDSRGVYQESGDYQGPHCLIYVDPQGEKTLVLDKPGELPPLTLEQMDLSLMDETDIVYLDVNPALTTPELAKMAKGKGKKVVLNIQDNMTTIHDRGLTDTALLQSLKYLDVFAPCQEGIKELSHADDVNNQIKFIRRYYKGLIILTLGTKGLVAVDERNNKYELPAYKVNSVDTTGAGDSFIGSFMVTYLVKGQSLQSALKFSTASAALTCLKFGAQSSPDFDTVQKFVADNPLNFDSVGAKAE